MQTAVTEAPAEAPVEATEEPREEWLTLAAGVTRLVAVDRLELQARRPAWVALDARGNVAMYGLAVRFGGDVVCRTADEAVAWICGTGVRAFAETDGEIKVRLS